MLEQVAPQLTCEDLRLVEDAVVAGVGHEHVGGVVLTGLWLAPQQRDLVAVADDVHLVDSRQRWSLHLRDLVVVHVRLQMNE